MRRDGGCVAPKLAGGVDACGDRWGGRVVVVRTDSGALLDYGALTLDHVRDHPMMGKRAPSDPEHLVTLCWHHHLDGWATGNRPLLRRYLASVS